MCGDGDDVHLRVHVVVVSVSFGVVVVAVILVRFVRPSLLFGGSSNAFIHYNVRSSFVLTSLYGSE